MQVHLLSGHSSASNAMPHPFVTTCEDQSTASGSLPTDRFQLILSNNIPQLYRGIQKLIDHGIE